MSLVSVVVPSAEAQGVVAGTEVLLVIVVFVLSAEIVVEAYVLQLADFAVLEIGHSDMKLAVSFVLASFETVVKLAVIVVLAF